MAAMPAIEVWGFSLGAEQELKLIAVSRQAEPETAGEMSADPLANALT